MWFHFGSHRFLFGDEENTKKIAIVKKSWKIGVNSSEGKSVFVFILQKEGEYSRMLSYSEQK